MLLLFGLVGCGDEPVERGSDAGASVPSGSVIAGRDPVASPRSGSGAGLVKNVLLISLDTLRADRLGLWGHGRGTSPNLDAIGSRAVVFRSVRAQAPQTAPSHASLFTGEYPGVHRIINVHGPHPKLFTLPEGLTTLAEVLDGEGFDTGAFVSGGNLTGRMGMDRGFDVWDEAYTGVEDRVNRLVEWMFAPGRGRFFAFLHTYQVHAPYLPRRDLVAEFTDPAYEGPLRARTEHFLAMPEDEAWRKATGPEYWDGMLDYTPEDIRFLSDLYDAEIRQLDGEVRRLFEYLTRSELMKDTAVVILSDHGEEFHDHGKYQHDQVYDELLHVPLIVRMPPDAERAGMVGEVDVPVELIDVPPTILEMVGIDPGRLGEVAGQSLLPLIEEPGRSTERFREPVFAELVVDPGPKYHWAIVWQGWKYVLIWQKNIDHTWEQLFHLDEDPGERRNLIDGQDPETLRVLGLLRERLRQHRVESGARAASVGPGGSGEVDDDMRQQMIALGYVEASAGLPLGPEGGGAPGHGSESGQAPSPDADGSPVPPGEDSEGGGG